MSILPCRLAPFSVITSDLATLVQSDSIPTRRRPLSTSLSLTTYLLTYLTPTARSPSHQRTPLCSSRTTKKTPSIPSTCAIEGLGIYDLPHRTRDIAVHTQTIATRVQISHFTAHTVHGSRFTVGLVGTAATIRNEHTHPSQFSRDPVTSHSVAGSRPVTPRHPSNFFDL